MCVVHGLGPSQLGTFKNVVLLMLQMVVLNLASPTVEVFDWYDNNKSVKEQERLRCQAGQANRQYQLIGRHVIPPWKTFAANIANKTALKNYLSVYMEEVLPVELEPHQFVFLVGGYHSVSVSPQSIPHYQMLV